MKTAQITATVLFILIAFTAPLNADTGASAEAVCLNNKITLNWAYTNETPAFINVWQVSQDGENRVLLASKASTPAAGSANLDVNGFNGSIEFQPFFLEQEATTISVSVSGTCTPRTTAISLQSFTAKSTKQDPLKFIKNLLNLP